MFSFLGALGRITELLMAAGVSTLCPLPAPSWGMVQPVSLGFENNPLQPECIYVVERAQGVKAKGF